MDERAIVYRDWILNQSVISCSITQNEKGDLDISSNEAKGYINFYEINDFLIVEMRLERLEDGEPAFFLHFELEDLDRAKELFFEMAQTIEGLQKRENVHVLLCCSCGITTTFFSNKLNECAQAQGLNYDFCAKPLVDAQREGSSYAAVLLAPQVGHQRKQVADLMPGTPVLELPARIFGAYDAPAALALVREVLEGAREAAASDLRMAREYDNTKRILAVSFIWREDEPTLSYSVFDHGKKVDGGMAVYRHFDVQDLIDLAPMLRVKGWDIESFDAVGVALPVRIDGSKAIYWIKGERMELDVSAMLQKRWNVPVYVDNISTAAAAGCYVSQDKWDYVGIHAQMVGIADCNEGFVQNGLPMYGYRGFMGNLGYLAKSFPLSMDLAEAAWRYDGIRELVAYYIAVASCTIAPEVMYVWCDLIPDMDELREEILKLIPEEGIPELVAIANFDDYIIPGEIALCLQRLAQKG